MWSLIRNVISKRTMPIHLGRWCHPGVDGCNYKVIERKADLANMDNNLNTPVDISPSTQVVATQVVASAHGLESQFTNELVAQYLILDGYYKL